jgi:CPA1 family monovalent cation:H+ antiporter
MGDIDQTLHGTLSIERVEVLLLIAAVVALVARRFRIPYSVGLVLAGIALSLLPFVSHVQLTREMLFTAFLPPLIFEASLYIPWKELRRDLPVILVLVTIGLLLSAGLTAAGMHYLVGWQWTSGLLFGALIAATDPVSVIAMFKEAGVHGRLRLLMEAESLFNDSTAAVAFSIVLALATGGDFSAIGIVQELFVSVFGGVLCGGVLAGFVLLLAGRTEDHLVEITFTTVAAYGSFLLAEHFHFSGIMATLIAGLLIGNVGPSGAISAKGKVAVEAFWEYAAFVANSLIFILIGMREAQQNFAAVLTAVPVAIILVLIGRAVAIYPCCVLFKPTSLRVKARHQHILFWGGLRGALALALALGLPPEVPRQEEIISVAFAVVAFSLFVQGLTMNPLLRKLGEIPHHGE